MSNGSIYFDTNVFDYASDADNSGAQLNSIALRIDKWYMGECFKRPSVPDFNVDLQA